MTLQPKMHLTEEELEEALMGTGSPEGMIHLANCASCSAHLEQFDATMAIFNRATVAWSEAKSNALTRDLKQHRTPLRITAGAAWACASILVLAATATLGLGLHERSAHIAASQPSEGRTLAETASFDANVQSEVASDDAMLRQIDSAIDNAEPSPEELYEIQSASSVSRQNSNQTQVKD